MKEIGQTFKDKREEIGITIKEVASDLKINDILIENLEEGNSKVFKDVLEIKEVIENYSRYLGLDVSKMLDEYNDYLFEKTSKISLDDIKESLKKNPAPKKKIRSPYTIELQEKNDYQTILIIIGLVVLVLVLLYFVLRAILIA